MKIAVIGQGYVGTPLAKAAANAGHHVYGFDINSEVIAQLVLSEANTSNYTPTADPKVIVGCDIYIIAVPTPLDIHNQPDLSYLKSAAILIGEVARDGALIINDPELVDRSRILLEKGTNRHQFINGQVDKYTWVDIGSSYLPSEITAAYLRSQLEKSNEITEYRLKNWNYYFDEFNDYSQDLGIKTITPPEKSQHNAHIFFLILQSKSKRDAFIKEMALNDVSCHSHYIPLHSSLAGKKFGLVGSQMVVTETMPSRLVRLPMWSHEGMPIEFITNKAINTLKKIHSGE